MKAATGSGSCSFPELIVLNRQRTHPVNLPDLKRFADRALRLCWRLPKRKAKRLPQIHEIHVVLISDRRMSGLHRQFLGIHGPTDVITFQHGEIFVSVETAKRQAFEFRTSLSQEIRLYVVHGLLHLCGYDDGAPVEARSMAARQARILQVASK